MLDSVFSYCSWLENDQASVIDEFVDCNRHYKVPRQEVDNFLDRNHIDYSSLPSYLKDKLDEVDIL